MPIKSKLVEEQISKLTINNENSPPENIKSPTIQKLRDVEHKVQKLKQMFEDGTSNVCHMNDNKKKYTSPTQILRSLDCRRSSSKSPKNESTVNKIDRIIGELIEKENEYIQTLQNGIRNYIHPILSPTKCHITVPREIRLQKYKLFGNIEDIYRLHKSTILPQIMACEQNVQKIAETFIKLVQNDSLYCYIEYVIIHLHAKEMVASYRNFFQALQHSCHDYLGVQSFILQPIQKLPRYPLIFEEMIKELSSDMQANKSSLASLCVAKRKIEKFLIRMNQALRLNDIKETHDLDITIQYGLLNTLQIEFHDDINKPHFLIVPSLRDFSDNRLPVNVFDLGHFITIENFECQEDEPYELYFSELFLFEKSLIYTKKCGRGDASYLIYRDNFKFGPHTSIHLEQEHKSFTIGSIKVSKIVTFKAYSMEKIVQFFELIKIYHDRRKSFDSEIIADLDSCVDGSSISSVSTAKSHECCTKEYAKNYNNNNNQPAFGNEANMSENMANHDIADDSNFGWSSDEFSSCDDFQVYKKTPKLY